MFNNQLTISLIRGLLIAIFLMALGLDLKNWRWWVSCLSLNILMGIQ